MTSVTSAGGDNMVTSTPRVEDAAASPPAARLSAAAHAAELSNSELRETVAVTRMDAAATTSEMCVALTLRACANASV